MTDGLITDHYRALNLQLHHARPHWGTTGHKWSGVLGSVCRRYGSSDVLDYGCGKQSLRRSFGASVRGYDPAIPELAATPEPADVVACLDVLEHIEPECIEAVLDHLGALTRRGALIVIATRPAIQILPDGRNAHLIQMPIGWWRSRLAKRFSVVYQQNIRDLECVFLCEPSRVLELSPWRS
jgi:hypothetical protein